jgi:hypothetical protein
MSQPYRFSMKKQSADRIVGYLTKFLEAVIGSLTMDRITAHQTYGPF